MSKKNNTEKKTFKLPSGFEQTKRGRNSTIPVEEWTRVISLEGFVTIGVYHSSEKKVEGAFSSLGVRKAIAGKGFKYCYGLIKGKDIMMIASLAYSKAFGSLSWRNA